MPILFIKFYLLMIILNFKISQIQYCHLQIATGIPLEKMGLINDF